MEKWPIYKDKLVRVGNPLSNIAVVTCWTDLDKSSREIPMDLVAAIGNLYAPSLGLDFIIANVLAHSYISEIVVTGSDKQGGGQALINLIRTGFEHGTDEVGRECWRVINDPKGRISKDFTREQLERFCSSVRVHDCRSKLEEVNGLIRRRYREGMVARRPQEIKLTEVVASEVFPNASAGFRIIGKTVAEVWLRAMEYILRFGMYTKTQYQTGQQESLVITSVITGENPGNLFYPGWLPQSREDFDNYLPQVIGMEATSSEVSYQYGQRMRKEWGDQVQGVIDKLRKDPDTRQAVISLWDNKSDLQLRESPCFNYAWFRIRDNKLYLTAVLRSNDMYRAFPSNAFALRILQNLVREQIDPKLKLGDLIVESLSAHIYEETTDLARATLQQHRSEVIKVNHDDPAGSFVVSVEDGMIKVLHATRNGTALQEFSGKTARSLSMQVEPFISQVGHGIYLGMELIKAEHALLLGLPYNQDRSLINRKTKALA